MTLAHLIQRTEARVAFPSTGPLPKSAALQRQRGDDFETYSRMATGGRSRRRGGVLEFDIRGLSCARVAGSINLIKNSLYNIDSHLTFF
jgi:hypothetical protein